MLDSIKKLVNKTTKEPEMAKPENGQVELSVVQSALADAQAALSEKTTELLTAQSALAEMASKFESINQQLAAVSEHRDAVLAKAKAEKDEARLSSIKASVGDEKAPALFAATANMSDEDFQAVVGALAGSVVTEGQSKMFTEVGISAEANVAQVSQLEESKEMKILKAKYTKVNK